MRTASQQCFGFPELEDSGLGNMLVPWAKSLIWCRDHEIRMIAPHWGRHGVARDYRGCFTDQGYVSGVRRTFLLGVGARVSSGSAPQARAVRPVIVTFRGLEHIEPVLGRHREVADELWRITNPALRPTVPSTPFIALHVRRGDFGTAPEDLLRTGAPNVRQPIHWYAQALGALRRSLEAEIPATIFSDGSEDELAPLLGIDRVIRSPYKAAITDILLLSRAATVVGSRSTFSAWASFLGQTPIIYFPGARPCGVSLISGPSPFAHEPEWDYGQPLPQAFLSAARRRL